MAREDTMIADADSAGESCACAYSSNCKNCDLCHSSILVRQCYSFVDQIERNCATSLRRQQHPPKETSCAPVKAGANNTAMKRATDHLEPSAKRRQDRQGRKGDEDESSDEVSV